MTYHAGWRKVGFFMILGSPLRGLRVHKMTNHGKFMLLTKKSREKVNEFASNAEFLCVLIWLNLERDYVGM